MWMLKLSRLDRTVLHLIQSTGHRSFWIWFSYSLTAVLLLLFPPDSDLAGDRADLETMAALARWSRVSLACCLCSSLGLSLGARMAAISAFFFWMSPLSENGRLKSGKAAG